MPKLNTQIIGSFAFRNEGDGCLTSKYHHADSTQGPFTESCKLITPIVTNDIFIGSYTTAWIDENNVIVSAFLIIERDLKNLNLFKLTWQKNSQGNVIMFEGSGMFYGENLIGAYWN